MSCPECKNAIIRKSLGQAKLIHSLSPGLGIFENHMKVGHTS